MARVPHPRPAPPLTSPRTADARERGRQYDDRSWTFLPAGGGALTFTTPNSTQTVNPPFTGPNPVTSFSYAAPGGVTSPASGAYATNACTDGSAIAWGPGHLSNAPTAALVVVFDVNFMQAAAGVGPTNFLKNLIGFINAGGGPVGPVLVPTLGTYSLVLLALLLAAGSFMVLRRRG